MPNQEHLTDSERGHYEKSIGKLQQASTLEKILLWVIAIAAITAAVFSYQGKQKALESAEAAQERQNQLLAEIKNSTDEIDRHLDCIVVFFTHPNRADLSIKDIDNCVVQDGDVIIPLRDTNPDVDVLIIPKPPADEQGSQQQAPPPNNSDNQPPDNPKPPENPPREVLGIPVCVPFTGVCVRQNP